MTRFLTAMVVALALLLPGSFAEANRLDPGRPGAEGYLFCTWNTIAKINLYICGINNEVIPDYKLLELMMTELTEIHKLEEVFKVEVLIVPPESGVMSAGLRGFYEFMNGTVFIRDNEPDQYRLILVIAHEISHAILDQVKGVHGSLHHEMLICNDILRPLEDRLDEEAGKKLEYIDPRLKFKMCIPREGWPPINGEPD